MNSPWVLTLISAFSGAFFAYLFTRIASFFSKYYQRQVRNFNSLILLENEMNISLGIIHDNLYIIPQFIRVITSGNVYFNNLNKIEYNVEHFNDLYDLEYMNKLFEYYSSLRKINDDIQTCINGYQEIKEALIEHHINIQDYKLNTDSLASNLKIIEAFLIQTQNSTIDLLAETRVRIKQDKPLAVKIQQILLDKTIKKTKESDVLNERKKLILEIEENKGKSQREIENVLRNNKLI